MAHSRPVSTSVALKTCAEEGTHISRGRGVLCQHGAFSGVGAVVASFVPAECPKRGGGGMWSIFEKYLKRAIWSTLGLHAVLTICLRFLSFLGSTCVACCLFMSTGSYHVRIQIHATCCCFSPDAPPKPLVRKRARSGGCPNWVKVTQEPGRQAKKPRRNRYSNLHARTRNTRFCPLLRPLLLQPSFGIVKSTSTRLPSMNFWRRALTLIWSRRLCMQIARGTTH